MSNQGSRRLSILSPRKYKKWNTGWEWWINIYHKVTVYVIICLCINYFQQTLSANCNPGKSSNFFSVINHHLETISYLFLNFLELFMPSSAKTGAFSHTSSVPRLWPKLCLKISQFRKSLKNILIRQAIYLTKYLWMHIRERCHAWH